MAITGDALYGDPTLVVPAGPASASQYELFFSPLVAGVSTGSVSFINPTAGEFWYELKMTAEAPTPVELPTLHCSVGGSVNHTFTITSVGNIGGRFATPIINHPEVAILGVNQIHDRPMVVDGEIVARKMMYLSPSFDHRVIDGAVAARFVAALKAVLETPEVLLVEGL